jgi:CheY-like chemotaxis protein
MKVLIVDDATTVRALVRLYLIPEGWDLDEASDGVEALAKLRAARPDVVITDANMPNMDGFELCAAIRRTPGLTDLPVVFLTLHGDHAARERARLAGATAFLTKPIAPADLKEAVRSAVAGKTATV